MSNLRAIVIKHSELEHPGIEVSWLFPFLDVPSVRSFEVSGIENDSPNVDHKWNRNFNTKKLVLNRAPLFHWTLLKLLPLFPNLEYLHYSNHALKVSGHVYLLPLQKFFEAIQHLKPCLRHLTILNDCWPPPAVRTHRNWGIVSLKDFYNLKTLDLKTAFIFTEGRLFPTGDSDARTSLAKSLPPQLESLTLRNFSKVRVPHIFRLIAEKNTLVPGLKHLDLGWGWENTQGQGRPDGRVIPIHPGFTDEEAEMLLCLCQEAGIDMAWL
jgi:hypothetical protein